MTKTGAASAALRMTLFSGGILLALLSAIFGFVFGAWIVAGDYDEGDIANLLSERSVLGLLAERSDESALTMAAERLFASSPVTGVHFFAAGRMLYGKSIDERELPPSLVATLDRPYMSEKLVREEMRAYYIRQLTGDKGQRLSLVLTLARGTKTLPSILSRALAGVAGDPVLIPFLAGLAMAAGALFFACLVVWRFFSRPLARIRAALEAHERGKALPDGPGLLGASLMPSINDCLARTDTGGQASGQNALDFLLPVRRGYDFAGYDAATVYGGSGDVPALHADIRPLGNGRYAWHVLAIDAGDEESRLALVRVQSELQVCFSLFDNAARVVSALNRHVHAAGCAIPVSVGTVLWEPERCALEICLCGAVSFLRHDVRSSEIRDYAIAQGEIGTVSPEEFDRDLTFARLEAGSGDTFLLASGAGIDWKEILTVVLQKAVTHAERQQLLSVLVGQKNVRNVPVAALIVSVRP